jgi:hypothetical protein
LIGEYKNGGSDYRPAGCPDGVQTRDFADKELGKVAPYGIYDLATNTGWVSLGIDHDTAEFAVNAVRRWLQAVGSVRYPGADTLLITADGGGSNGSRVRLFKTELQKLADETRLIFQVCHYPSGSRSSISSRRRQPKPGSPCELDENTYAKGIKVSDAEMEPLNIETDDWHPEWNYTIKPRPSDRSDSLTFWSALSKSCGGWPRRGWWTASFAPCLSISGSRWRYSFCKT